jgi:hypothetical protein
MEDVGAAASAVADSELAAVSADIDTTVSELRAILGGNGKDGGGRDA